MDALSLPGARNRTDSALRGNTSDCKTSHLRSRCPTPTQSCTRHLCAVPAAPPLACARRPQTAAPTIAAQAYQRSTIRGNPPFLSHFPRSWARFVECRGMAAAVLWNGAVGGAFHDTVVESRCCRGGRTTRLDIVLSAFEARRHRVCHRLRP